MHVSKDTGHRVWKEAGLNASRLTLDGQRRSGVREESGRYHRPVSASTATCRRFLYRRKDRHSSPGSFGTGSAAFARPRRASRLRILPAGPFSVCGTGYRDWARAWKNGGSPHQRRLRRFSRKSFRGVGGGKRSTLFSTISRRTKPRVRDFLEEHPKVRLHFTPTYSSWLNEVELWFAKSNATSSLAASSLLCPTWHASFAAISTLIQPTHVRFAGSTLTHHAASIVTNSLRQATSFPLQQWYQSGSRFH